jgi:hypothetical protein
MSEGKIIGRRINTNDSQIMPPVTISIPMPQGASAPARPSPAHVPAESSKGKK